MSRLIGLDHGSRRIGVAVADTETRLAFARPALRRRNQEADLAALTRLAHDEGANRFVIGLPLLEDGSEGTQAATARSFGARLGEASGRPVAFSDERWTSWKAGADLQAAGRRPTRASGELDSAAARVILQQYLDALVDPPTDVKEPA